MQYMCLIYQPHNAPEMSEQEGEALFAEYGTFTQEALASGKMRGGEPLQPENDATTVRVRNGKTTITDGPYAETKEWLGGYYTFDCDTLDEALDWAAKIPGSRYGSIEVRPLLPVPGRPTDASTPMSLQMLEGKKAFLGLIYLANSGAEMSEAEGEALMAEYNKYSMDIAATGKLLGGEPLQPPTTATTVRVRDGKRVVTDGPYAETKEWLAGYYAYACDTIEEAQALAAKCPGARDGSIEIRPIMPIPSPVAN